MKYTLLVTQRCNLACDYCYIAKREVAMSLDTARAVVDFAFRNTPATELVEFGFFGGEPLLELARIREIVRLIEAHPWYARERVKLTVVTNGTVLTDEVVALVSEHDVAFGISCDGPPEVQDRHRRTRLGHGSGSLVERNIRSAVERIPGVMVNAVYRPDTLPLLPDTVAYLSSLGVRHIYLNPDFTARWTAADAAALAPAYRAIADQYRAYRAAGDPHFISVLDTKIAVILRDGYRPLERCRMGRGEFAFSPEGYIYPCERLVGDGGPEHRIGHVATGIRLAQLRCGITTESTNEECADCGVRAYCMNWCGCTNYFMTGAYDRAGAFLCAAERASIRVAFELMVELDGSGAWYDHVSGRPDAAVRRS